MSIIHDALKKVQKNLPGYTSPDNSEVKKQNIPKDQSQDTFATPNPSAITPSNRPNSYSTKQKTDKVLSSSAKNKTTLFVTASIILILILGYFYTVQWQTTQQIFLDSIRQTTLPPRIPVISPKTQAEEKPKIVIKGIMKMDDQTLALINDNIYQEGDVINDITVTEITSNSVTILDNGKLKTLKVQASD